MKKSEFAVVLKSMGEVNVSGHTIKYNETAKGTKIFKGVNVAKDGQKVSPNIYLDNWWNERYENMSIDDLLQELIKFSDECMENNKLLNFSLDSISVENIIPCLVNSEAKMMLKDKPNRKLVGDVAIYYRIKIEGTGTILVSNDLMKRLGIESEEQLYNAAIKNMDELSVVTMESMLSSIMLKEPLDKSVDALDFEDDEGVRLFVATNDSNMYGASVGMLNTSALKRLSEIINDDVYIIPSSIHEVLYIAGRDLDENELKDMICDVNLHALAEEERLSNHLFKYDKERSEIVVAA